MSEYLWKEGYKVGFAAGYAEGFSDAKSINKEKATKIHDPGEIDEIYEQAYGAALYRQMKKDHDKF